MTDLDEQDINTLAAALDEALAAALDETPAEHRDAAAGGTGRAWPAYTDLGLFDIVGTVTRPGPALAALFRTAGRHLAPGPLAEEAFVRP